MALTANHRPLRVVHLPTAVGGHAPTLARAERRLGLDSVCVTIDEPAPGYRVDRVLAPPGTPRSLREVRRWRLLLELLTGADVVHFNFGQPLTPVWHSKAITGRRGVGGVAWSGYSRLTEMRELSLLRVLGKTVCVTYQGDDARQRHTAPPETRGLYDDASDARKRRRIRAFDRAAVAVFALNPDLLDVLPRATFLPYASVDLEDWKPRAHEVTRVPLVVHAPSDRVAKGTSHVLAAIERLRAEGMNFEFLLVEGMKRSDAREIYERADVVIDQLVLGWYGGVAVEAMALGTPVIAHISDDQLARVPSDFEAELPILRSTRDTLAPVIRKFLMSSTADRVELRSRARAFVERWHDPLAVARTTVAAYGSGGGS
jgi:hypothetical protein